MRGPPTNNWLRLRRSAWSFITFLSSLKSHSVTVIRCSIHYCNSILTAISRKPLRSSCQQKYQSEVDHFLPKEPIQVGSLLLLPLQLVAGIYSRSWLVSRKVSCSELTSAATGVTNQGLSILSFYGRSKRLSAYTTLSKIQTNNVSKATEKQLSTTFWLAVVV